MKCPTPFHLVSDICNQTGATCVLIGGFAVNYYKVTRQTADVDFLITKEDFERISGLLEKAGYSKDYAERVFIRFKSDGSYLMDIDFMFVDRDTLNKIIEKGKEISIAKQKFIVPSLDTLIALKIHTLKYNIKIRQSKDLPDIIDLIRINKINFRSKEFRDLYLKYGTEEIYGQIMDKM